MRPRLTRSRTDAVIAGVCGGLGEYFTIDPIIARLFFVLVTFSSGIGVPVYLLLWLIMPRKRESETYPQISHQDQEDSMNWDVAHLRHSSHRKRGQVEDNMVVTHSTSVVQRPQVSKPAEFQPGTPPPNEYKFDPQTGQPIHSQSVPSIGPTIKLEKTGEKPVQPTHAQQTPPIPLAPSRQQKNRNWRKLGIVLIGMGGLFLLNQLGFDMGYIIAILMIVVGFKLLKRQP